ncbi:cytochrome c biogenesis protein ResB [Siminovitchia sp. FSL H7-0308]|uniref:Cytochrome c biogenesis protein n=1 Tax=Siminovitchia thermophila TaxID=1245522 RepID=A0ABS2R2Q0_9BACI|nr:cytochrome c biogenesis protein ResB [Siminovitchia thermophila]MBM7713675.1 cytochrome c biogenesis protein [Siminovitchia thermophila]ONK21865.1 cytochrome C biogenesis protein [Bacillus sp. VT-16-64]
MNDVKCVCGHVNPQGTILCEACGRALTEEAKKENLHDMRYEGSARRSQTYNKTLVDKIWNFFSSVKVGVWLIVITLIASALGTILPQVMYIPPNADPAEYYSSQYGAFGTIYYNLGFHDLYSSWWYLLLIASIGVSLVICSLDRVIPLHRALKNQRVDRHEGFLKRQRLFRRYEGDVSPEDIETFKKRLKQKKYKIREQDGSILAEKGRFSRWGPYVNHIGLIIFLIGGMLRFVPGMYVDEEVWLREGEKKTIPGTNNEYVLESKKNTVEFYDKEKDKEVYSEALERVGSVVKEFQSDVVLYKRDKEQAVGSEEKLIKVKDAKIRVNEPLKFDNFAVYQVNFKQDEFQTMTFSLIDKKTETEHGEVTIDLFDPKTSYDLKNGYKVELLGYYPDFSGFAKNGEPQTNSPVPNNPAFLFNMISPEKPDGEVSFTAIRQTVEPLGETEYKMAFKGIGTRNATGLTVRKDLTLWVLAVGGTIFMIGVIQGSYWNHRRIWLQHKQGQLLIAGHTNKNWHSLRREITGMVEGTSIPEPIDQSQKEKNGKESRNHDAESGRTKQ